MSLELENLYYRYGPMVLRRCKHLLFDDDLAQDAMQEVFIKALKSESKLEFSAPSSLLYRIATNVCLNIIRERKVKFPDGEHTILTEIANSEDLERLTIARRLLENIFRLHPESTRVIAILHYHDGLTLKEVAKEVGMSISGVRKRLRLFNEKVGKFKNEFNS